MHRDTIKLNKMEYSNISNFSQKLVRNYTIIPIIWLILFLYVYISGSQDAKMFRDIAYAICILSIAIYNLNTDRQEDYVEYMNKKEQEQICEEVTENVSDRNAKLLKSIIELMENEQIFLNSDLRLQDIVKRLNSNRNYVSEAIVQSEYGSFYFLVNSFRVDYAAKLITENPNFTMDAIAMQSGFSSRQILTKSFKEHKKKSPSEYKIIS